MALLLFYITYRTIIVSLLLLIVVRYRCCSVGKINGGFFKYYPKDVKYIYDKFMKDPNHWQTHYIKNKTNA